MVDLGSVSIKITPNIEGFQRALKAHEKTLNMDIGIEFDKAEAKRSLDILQKTLQSLEVDFEVDKKSLAGITKAVEAVERTIEEIDINFDVDAGELSAEATAAVRAAQAATPDIKVGMDTRGFSAALAGINSSVGRVAGSITRLGALTAGGIAAAGAAGIGAILARGFGSLKERELALAKLNAVIKSTGGVAGQSRKEVERLAKQLSEMSGFSGSTLLNTQTMLLRFTNIRNEVGKNNDVFVRATELALDFSRAFKVDPEKAAIQLGKALNDPVRGLTLLGRRGIQFTEEQKKMIAGFVEVGDLLSAQKIVLGELDKRIGGTAAAAGDTLPIALEKTIVAFDAFSRSVVAGASPAMVGLLNQLQALFRTGADGSSAFSKQMVNLVNGLVSGFGRVLVFIKSADFKTFLGSVATAFQTTIGAVQSFGAAFSSAFAGKGESQSFIVSLGEAMKGLAGVFAEIAPIIGRVLGVIVRFVSENPKLVATIWAVTAALGALAASKLFAGLLLSPVLKLVGGFKQLVMLRSTLAAGGALTGFQTVLVKIGAVFGSIGRFISTILFRLSGLFPILGRIAFLAFRFATPLGAVVSILGLILLKFQPVRDIVNTIAGLIKTVLLGAFNALKDGATRVLGELKSALDFVTFGLTGIGDEADKTSKRIEASMGEVGSVLDKSLDLLSSQNDKVRNLMAKNAADKRVGEAIKSNISDAQVEALKRNKRLAEVSSADINAAFRRIGRVAVSTGFRRSLQRSLGGLLDQARFIRERININLQRIGMVQTARVFADTFIAQIQRVLSAAGPFANTLVAIMRSSLTRVVISARMSLGLYAGIFRATMLRTIRILRTGLMAAVTTIRGFEDEFFRAGKLLIQGFQNGLEKSWAYTASWLAGREQVIRDLKGPLAYDKTILYDAGRAVMGGFQTGLETSWMPIQSWLSGRGSLMKGLIGTNVVSDLAQKILLGEVDDPSKALGGLEPETPRFWTSYADMLRQATDISKMFNVLITSTFRDVATNASIGGARNSYHTQGRAVDFAGSTGNMDALAGWAEEFQKFFAEILWRTVGHFDHVHLAWNLAKAMGLPRREKGGSVRSGQSYLVGERGAEIFTPNVTGRILSHQQSQAAVQSAGAAYNAVYNVHANGLNEQSVQALLNHHERKMIRRLGLV